MVDTETLEAIERTTDELLDDSVEFLREMIRTPSVNPPADYGAIHDLVTGRYEARGWDVETVHVPEGVLEDLGLDPSRPRPNVLADVVRGDGPTIALNAHLDTVPVEDDQWSYDPFGAEIDGGRIWGRGARDSKGRIAAYTLAVRALEEADLLPDEATVTLAITTDEETGGQAGPKYLVESGAVDPDYAIVEGRITQVEHASSGVLHFEVSVEGASSHAGVALEEGANAVVGAARIVTALEEYGRELGSRESDVAGVDSPTCTPATVSGGVKTNVVPASCRVTVDRRITPDEDVDAAEREFRERVAEVSLPPGVDAEVAVNLRARPFRSDPEEPQVRALQRNAEAVRGTDVPVRGSRGFSDARFFAQGGARTAKYGPGDEASNVHGPDENVAIDQLRDAAAVVAATVLDLSAE